MTDRAVLLAIALVGVWVIVMVVIAARLHAVREAARTAAPPEDKERKRLAKRENERLKLTAAFLNGIGITLLLTQAAAPIFAAMQRTAASIPWAQSLTAAGLAMVFHLLGLWVLQGWRSEE